MPKNRFISEARFTPLTLKECDIHLWFASLNHNLKHIKFLEKLLSEEERLRVSQFKNQQAKEKFIISRGILKNILSHYLSIQAQAINLAYEKFGKPILSKALLQTHPGFSFNLSHSNDVLI